MSNTDIGTLPEWDLADLYPATDSDALKADLATAAAKAEAFETVYAGKLGGLSGSKLGAAIAEYEIIDGLLGRIMSYAGLVHAGAIDDPEVGRFYQTMQERVTDISARVLFFTLEINNLDDAALATMMKAPAAAKYAPWVREQRAFRPYQGACHR